MLQLNDIPRESNILMFHIHQGLNEDIEKLAYFLRWGYHTMGYKNKMKHLIPKDISPTTPSALKMLHGTDAILVAF